MYSIKIKSMTNPTVEMHTMREIINVDVASFRLLGGAMLLRSRKRVGRVQPVEAYLLK